MKSLTLALLFITISIMAFARGPVRLAPAPEPQTANDFFQTGFTAAGSGQYDLAIHNYTLAIGLDPTRIYFYYHRGMAYKAAGKKAEARKDFNQCISMKPIAEAYYELGVYKYDDLDLAGAKVLFETARSLKEDLEKTNYYLGIIDYRFNQYDSADAYLERYTHLVKTNADAFLYHAMVKVRMHKYEDVPALLNLASLYNDNDWKLHLKMYDIYKEMGDKANMLYNISMVIEMGQAKPEYYAIRAQLYLDLGDDMRAGYDLEAAKGTK